MSAIANKYFHLILDESFDKELFVVGGIVALNDRVIEDAIYQVRKKIKSNKSIKGKTRDKLLNEIKDKDLRGNYKGFKAPFFNYLKQDTNIIFIGAYVENNPNIKVEEKYFSCLKTILKHLYEKISNINIKITYDNFPRIIYDQFEREDKLESKVLDIKEQYNIESIESRKSQEDTRIQGADLICGLIRRRLREEEEDTSIEEDKLIILHA